MINNNDKNLIVSIARKFNVKKLILFGSSIDPETQSNDIDLGVFGIEPSDFFKFYGELFKNLSKPVDLIDLSEDNLFNRLIIKKGVTIYE